MSSTVQVTVHILDKDYQVACPEEEREALEEAAKALHERMKGIRDSGKVVGVDRIAVMAALNISHDLLECRAGRGDGASQVNEKIQLLQEKVEAALARASQRGI